jgi:SAM-dependent methyltransferase
MPERQVSRWCPACGSNTDHRQLYRKNGCDVLRCMSCGLGRSETAGFDPASYYDEAYFAGRREDGYADYLGTEAVLRREFARAVNFVREYRSCGRLVEIGCAYGFFLAEARRWFDVSGVELSAAAAAHCRRSGLAVTTGPVDETFWKRTGVVDAIVLLDVIEHLPDPHGTLVLCARHLAPDGIIVITTGDFDSPLARLAGRRWRLMTPPQHLWFFTERSFERLARRLGLRMEHSEHPAKLVPLSLVAFQLGRMLGLEPPHIDRISRLGIPVNLFDAMRIVLRQAHPFSRSVAGEDRRSEPGGE